MFTKSASLFSLCKFEAPILRLRRLSKYFLSVSLCIPMPDMSFSFFHLSFQSLSFQLLTATCHHLSRDCLCLHAEPAVGSPGTTTRSSPRLTAPPPGWPFPLSRFISHNTNIRFSHELDTI